MNHAYQAREDLKPKGLDGISDAQISQHWALYEGYVKNITQINERLSELSAKGEFSREFSELKRRLGFEYNGMVLHELYFGNLKGKQPPLAEGSDLMKSFKKCFGGLDRWKQEFSAVGKMRGIGWAVLYFDPELNLLSNHWIGMHEEGHPVGLVPLLVMDVWEHAYMVDHGASGRPAYIEAFFNNVDWATVESRLKRAARLEPVGVSAGARK